MKTPSKYKNSPSRKQAASRTRHPKKPIVISLGGSLVCPDQPDAAFLKGFLTFARKTSQGRKLIIIVGGGKVCRRYLEAARKFTKENEPLDMIGIDSTKLNARLVKTTLGGLCKDDIGSDPHTGKRIRGRILVAGGWKPGCSSDYDAVLWARECGAKTIINLTNLDHVYTADPRKNPKAKPLKSITWKEYRAIIPPGWTSGMSTPFDPKASKLAEKEGMTVYIINGSHLERMESAIKGKEFIGTRIGDCKR